MTWWLAQNAVIAGALALALMAFCRLVRLAPAARHALWLVVLIKLITPPLVLWPWPLGDVISAVHSQVGPDAVALAPGRQPVATLGQAAALPLRPDSNFEQPSPDAAESPLLMPAELRPLEEALMEEAGLEPSPDGWPIGAQSIASAGAAPPSEQGPDAGAGREAAHAGTEWSVGMTAALVLPYLVSAWLSGSACLAVIQLVRVGRLRRLLRQAERAPGWLRELVADAAASLSIRAPETLITPSSWSPLVCALGRPRLLWPESLSDELPHDSCRAVILHELAHLRRRDHWVGWLELLAGCVWWFNPVFWYARHQLRENAELACDAWVVAQLPRGRRAYAEALIEVSQRISFAAAPVLAAGMGSGARRNFERRLAMILREHIACRVPLVGLAAIGLVALAVLPGWSRGQAAAEPQQAEPVVELSLEAPPAGQNVPQASVTLTPPAQQRVAVEEAVLVLQSQPATTVQSTAPAAATRAVVTYQAVPATDEARIDQIEARLEQLLAEVRRLRAPVARETRAAPTRQARAVTLSNLAAQPVIRYRATASQDHGGVTMLARAAYKLSAPQAEALAAFINEHVKAEVEAKVDGDKLIITADPQTQNRIGQFIQLLDASAAGRPASHAVPPALGADTDPATPANARFGYQIQGGVAVPVPIDAPPAVEPPPSEPPAVEPPPIPEPAPEPLSR